MTSTEANKVVDLWAKMFEDDDPQVVKVAVLNLIKTLEFPPTIADIKQEINSLISVATGELTAVEEWNMIRNYVRNSVYNAQENFEKLPPIAKKFVGSPNQLRLWGMSCDFNESVVRGQFLKQYDILKKREERKAIIDKIGFKLIEGDTIKTIGGSND